MKNMNTPKNSSLENESNQITINTIATLIIVLLPILGAIVGIKLTLDSQVSLIDIGMLGIMYFLTMIGFDVGCHRYFAHHAFQTTTAVKSLLAILGLMSSQGGLLYWSVGHPLHHKLSDQPGDVQSPNLEGNDFWGKLKGLYNAQVGWVFKIANDGNDPENIVKFEKAIKDPLILKINELQLVWIILGLIIPATLEGLITMSWMGVFKGFIWGGLVRLFLVQQFAGTISSVCHMFGDRPYKTNDYSTNNFWLAIPTLGGSWHNNHHAFPNSAYCGLEWWQIDISNWVIWILEKTGLIWDVKKPTPSMIKARKLQNSSTN
uniref:Fatty-acid desaturase n=1 Tax=Anabaena sp. XPORK15F TaxID=462641 RepID=A0A0U2JSA1_9NOST|nr:fatty-acid desaturase [Anabaena sp. XPORK15F]